MLDKEKVKLMTELAFYEQNQGKEDFKINEYYRNDYTGFHAICSVIWVTLGYAGIVGLILFAGLDVIFANVSKAMIITMVIGIAGGYLIILILYMIISHHVFSQKHRESRQRIKIFNHNLTRLLNMYEKEKR